MQNSYLAPRLGVIKQKKCIIQSGAVTCSLVRFCEPCCPHRLALHELQEDQGLTTQSRGTHLPLVGEKQMNKARTVTAA